MILRHLAAITMLSASAAMAHDEVPGAPQQQPVALINGTVFPVVQPAIDDATLVFEQGIITAVGKNVTVPENAKVIDLKGAQVYPGLIEAMSQIGLREISAVRATRDNAESGRINPNVKAQVSFNPDSELIPVTRANGVLLAGSAPSGGLVSGRASVMQLDGWTYEQMTLKPDAALVVDWPNTPTKGPNTGLRQLRELMDDASAYQAARQSDQNQRFDIRLEAMLPILERRIPVLAKASRSRDIQAAVAFSVEYNIRLIIFGGHDAEQNADLLKKHNIPVIIDSVHRRPMRRHEPYDTAYTLPSRLHQKNVLFCISGYDRESAWNTRNLPYHAATAAAHGLLREEALRSVTLNAARILGIDDRVGSLQKGRDATIFVANGDPLDITTRVTRAWIQGRPVQLTSRHTRLYKKYRAKYQQLDDLQP